MLIEAGIPNVKELRALGPIDAYRRLRFHFGKRVTANFAYAIECALRGIDWRNLEPERKAAIKVAAKAIVEEMAAAARKR